MRIVLVVMVLASCKEAKDTYFIAPKTGDHIPMSTEDCVKAVMSVYGQPDMLQTLGDVFCEYRGK